MGIIVLLMIVGLIMVLAEIFLLPGIGVSGILGILSLSGASFLAFSDYGNVAGIVVTSIDVVLLAGLIILAFRAKTWKKVSLETSIESKAVVEEAMLVTVGQRGKAMTRLAPSGTVRFGNEKVEAKAFEGLIDAGCEVEVVLIEDNKIYVKPI